MKLVGRLASAGQAVPLQFSATSQTPPAGRHTGLPPVAVPWLQDPLTHWSTVHGLLSLVHPVPLLTAAQPHVPSANVVAPEQVGVWHSGQGGQPLGELHGVSPPTSTASAVRARQKPIVPQAIVSSCSPLFFRARRHGRPRVLCP